MSEPKETEPKVTVIMPSLNVAPFIRECMESVLRQTLMEIEIICVDAGSTDGTAEILQEYAEQDSRISFLHSDIRSYGHQVNLGLDAAHGEYLTVLETDDCIRSDMYRYLYTTAKANDAEVVRFDFWDMQGEGTGREIRYRSLAKDCFYGKVFCPAEVSEAFLWAPPPWTGIYRTDFIRRNGIRFNETPGAAFQDTGFHFQVMTRVERLYLERAAFVFYRTDNGNSSTLSGKKIFAICDECDFLRKTLDDDPERVRRFAGMAAARRFSSYIWNLDRIDPTRRPDFVQRFSADFRRLRDAGELDASFSAAVGSGSMSMLERIMDDPESWIREMTTSVSSGNPLADRYRNECEKLRNSTTYRVGRIFTGIPGRIKDRLKGKR